MDLFGLGGSELLVLALLAGVLLGPRRLARLARDIGGLLNQIRAQTSALTQQLNREIDMLDVSARKSGPAGEAEAKGATPAEELPEAYRRFRQDFPEEGKTDQPSGSGRPGKSLPGTPRPAQPGEASAVSPASLNPRKD
jgi:sec-independent protein translocase protein TatB